jgi:hypothetical protein
MGAHIGLFVTEREEPPSHRRRRASARGERWASQRPSLHGGPVPASRGAGHHQAPSPPQTPAPVSVTKGSGIYRREGTARFRLTPVTVIWDLQDLRGAAVAFRAERQGRGGGREWQGVQDPRAMTTARGDRHSDRPRPGRRARSTTSSGTLTYKRKWYTGNGDARSGKAAGRHASRRHVRVGTRPSTTSTRPGSWTTGSSTSAVALQMRTERASKAPPAGIHVGVSAVGDRWRASFLHDE